MTAGRPRTLPDTPKVQAERVRALAKYWADPERHRAVQRRRTALRLVKYDAARRRSWYERNRFQCLVYGQLQYLLRIDA